MAIDENEGVRNDREYGRIESKLAAIMLAKMDGVESFALPGGASLLEEGETSDSLYMLRTGRLAAIRRRREGAPQLLNFISPGEGVGEISLLGGVPHSATVIALRDSEILSMSRAAFLSLVRQEPAVMLELVRTLIRRSQSESRTGRGPTAFGFAALTVGINVRQFAERLAGHVRAFNSRITIVDAGRQSAETEWFSRLEQANDFLFYVAESGEDAWARICVRQSDWFFRLAQEGAPFSTAPAPGAQTDSLKRSDIILLHANRTVSPQQSGQWRKEFAASRVHHICPSAADDLARLARLITGRATGLVLSGGGARGYAHIGAVRALREHGVPIDYIGGASMGAVVAASVALGWDDKEMETRMRRAFVETNPLGDITLPLLALTKGTKVEERLALHFGEHDIADLWLPYFCVSSDLTKGVPVIHDRGPLVKALRASIALPGVLPPVCNGDTVLVDGGVMRNLPADMMRANHAGPIIAVDVSIDAGLSPKDVEAPKSLWHWFASGEWRKGPPILSLLLRSGTVTAERDLIAARHAADVLILPKLENVEIRNWKAYEPAVTAGYVATCEALEKLEVPVTELRMPRIAAR